MALVITLGDDDDAYGYYVSNLGFQAQMGEKFATYYDLYARPDRDLGLTPHQFSEFDPVNLIFNDPLDYWQVDLNGGNDQWCWLTGKVLDPVHDAWVAFTPRLIVNGGDGNDTIGGGSADDTVSGGAGNDLILESHGNDLYIISDPGDRIIISEPNISDWYGGAIASGNDTVSASIDYSLPSFIENLVLTGDSEINGNGNEYANNLTGNIASNILDGGRGADTLVGGAGDDVYVVDSSFDRVVELAGQGIDIIETGVSYVLPDFVEQGFLSSAGRNQNLTGNDLGNLLVGNGGRNVLAGLDGKDELRGEGGADSLFGGSGIDTLDGGTGADRMEGGGGSDIYYVDNGLDLVIEATSSGYDTVFTSVAIAMPDNVEKLVFNGLADGTMLSGNDLANFLVGNYTDDIIDVGAGNDSAKGGSGDDTMIGGSGNDTLLGEFGIDSIQGGLGRDVLFGGAGADLFIFVHVTDSQGANRDLIKDFEDGLDRIDVRQVDAAPSAGDQAFSFIGTDVFTAAGQIRTTYIVARNVTQIDLSIDTDPEAEMSIVLNGHHDLTAASFIL